MKRLFAALAMSLLCYVGYAQNMSVKSFELLESDMDARAHYRKPDQNGRPAAIIKVETTYKGFSFDVGSLGIVDIDPSKVAETWVYIPMGAIRMTIQHPTLGTIRDYEFPIKISEASVYRMVLTTDIIETVVKQRATGQYLILNITPSDIEATICVDGGVPIPVINGVYDPVRLPFGEHTYTVSAPMYQTFESKITSVSDSDNNRINATVELQPAFGYLEVSSTPQAKITINNLNESTTPFKEQLPFGTYDLTISAPQYQSHTQSVTISEPLQTVKIDHALTPYFSPIEISVAMSEATISINDQEKGRGEWSGTLMPGVYDIKADRPNHRPTIYTLEVQQNMPQRITLNPPTPMLGSLDASSNVIDAELFMDGQRIGLTPNFFDEIIAGTHTLELRHEGYITQRREVTITEGKITEVSFSLQRTANSSPTTRPAQTALDNLTELAEYSSTNYPTNSDTWAISDITAKLNTFYGLRDALYAAYDEGRKISLIFPNLKEVPSASGLTNGAFYHCKALVSVEIPKVTSVGDSAFGSCSALSSIDLPLVTSVGSSAFAYCSSLSSIDLPLATWIGRSAFSSCAQLATMSLAAGDGVQLSSVNTSAFNNVPTEIITLTLGSANREYVSGNTLTVGSVSETFAKIIIVDSNGNVYDNFNYLADYSSTSYPADSDTWIISDITAMLNTFYGLRDALYAAYDEGREISLIFPNLKEVTSTSSSTNSAFYYCRALVSVEMPKVTSVGDSAFWSCSSLSSIDLPLVTSVGSWAFYSCSSLSSIGLPLVTSVGSSAFSSCSSLSSIYLPLVTWIGRSAFYSCTQLATMSLAARDGVQLRSVDYTAFNSVSTEIITLTLGSANSGLVSGNTLTVGSFSETFKEIIVLDAN